MHALGAVTLALVEVHYIEGGERLDWRLDLNFLPLSGRERVGCVGTVLACLREVFRLRKIEIIIVSVHVNEVAQMHFGSLHFLLRNLKVVRLDRSKS